MVLTEMVPPTVQIFESFGDHAEPFVFPDEVAAVTNAVPQRQREFATGRHCAHSAVRKLGRIPQPILPDERRAPQWPEGVVGSITHCVGYCAAAVAEAGAIAAIGIDAEPSEPLPSGVRQLILADGDAEQLSHLERAAPDTHWDRLLFSAKESIYKAWYPITQRWLGFSEARVTFDPYPGTFHATLLVSDRTTSIGTLERLTGRWLIRDGLILTAVTLARQDSVRPV